MLQKGATHLRDTLIKSAMGRGWNCSTSMQVRRTALADRRYQRPPYPKTPTLSFPSTTAIMTS